MSDYTTTTTKPSTPSTFPGIFGLIIQDVELRFDSDDPVVQAVLGDLQGRRQYGLKKYGSELQPFDRNDMFKEAYQEALDMVVYWRQLIFERDHSTDPMAWQLVASLLEYVSESDPLHSIAVSWLKARGSKDLLESKGIA